MDDWCVRSAPFLSHSLDSLHTPLSIISLIKKNETEYFPYVNVITYHLPVAVSMFQLMSHHMISRAFSFSSFADIDFSGETMGNLSSVIRRK